MSYLVNEPHRFAAESEAGFVAAHGDLVRQVPGGVARVAATPRGQVAVVIGGGSGHHPAFGGFVGAGLAHAAALGNVFASPSAQQIHRVAREVEAGGGVLLSYGNYAGDVLNFGQAEQRLRADGIPCETVQVTDDVASAPAAEHTRRRGIAGDLVVFRAAAWAAEQGRPLAEVAAFARHANERTRTLGVAFSGCTLPGATEPLFTVPAGSMAVGMGIHGEPGIDLVPIPTADALAEMLVRRLLDDAPVAAGDSVAVIVNGLGSVKAEELHLLYRHVAELLAGRGIRIVAPEVGEFATSFEMAGVSLTLCRLDPELERAWVSPAHAPGYRRGTTAETTPRAETRAATTGGGDDGAKPSPVPPASEASQAAAGRAAAMLAAIRVALDAAADELGRLDAVAGDGDHGIGMQRGATAADAAARAAHHQGAGAGTALAQAGDAWAQDAGGTSGALWGAALRAAGEHLGDEQAPTPRGVADAIDRARACVQRLGGAQPGDKTLVDALVPFAASLGEQLGAGRGFADAWTAAARTAERAAADTAQLLPRTGRARTHAEKSLGTPDPGAISFAIAMVAAGAVLEKPAEGGTR